MKVNNFTGNSIYLDINFIYYFVRPIPEYKQEILYFFSKIEEGKIHAYTCVDTFDEYTYPRKLGHKLRWILRYNILYLYLKLVEEIYVSKTSKS